MRVNSSVWLMNARCFCAAPSKCLIIAENWFLQRSPTPNNWEASDHSITLKDTEDDHFNPMHPNRAFLYYGRQTSSHRPRPALRTAWCILRQCSTLAGSHGRTFRWSCARPDRESASDKLARQAQSNQAISTWCARKDIALAMQSENYRKDNSVHLEASAKDRAQ